MTTSTAKFLAALRDIVSAWDAVDVDTPLDPCIDRARRIIADEEAFTSPADPPTVTDALRTLLYDLDTYGSARPRFSTLEQARAALRATPSQPARLDVIKAWRTMAQALAVTEARLQAIDDQDQLTEADLAWLIGVRHAIALARTVGEPT